MTQPAASKLLLQLEAMLGIPLFRHHPRGVEPTEAGVILTRHARLALAELRQAGDEIAELRSGLRGHVSLGTEAASAATLVPQAVVQLSSIHNGPAEIVSVVTRTVPGRTCANVSPSRSRCRPVRPGRRRVSHLPAGVAR